MLSSVLPLNPSTVSGQAIELLIRSVLSLTTRTERSALNVLNLLNGAILLLPIASRLVPILHFDVSRIPETWKFLRIVRSLRKRFERFERLELSEAVERLPSYRCLVPQANSMHDHGFCPDTITAVFPITIRCDSRLLPLA
jgi:hypothetical protein